MNSMRTLRRFIYFTFLMVIFSAMPAWSQITLLSVSPRDSNLRTVNPANGATTGSVAMTLAGQTINGAQGLATHPLTGEVWVLLQVQGVITGRVLGKVNPTTGVVTSVGNTGDFFAGIAFDCAGNLYGVTGDGGNAPETFFLLDQTTGAATQISALGNGDFGEAIAFNSTNGMMYHASGFNTPIFESFDPTSAPPFVPTNIPITGTALENDEVTALAFEFSTGNFLWAQGFFPGSGFLQPGPLFRVTPAGVPTMLGMMDHVSKGLAFVGAGASGCPVDLTITKTDSPDPVNAGNTVTYTVTVNNVGMTSASMVTLGDPLPAGTTFFSLTAPAGWTCTTPAVGASGTVSCTHPNFLGGASGVFTLVVTTTGAAVPLISNTGTISSAETDINAANNSASTTTTVNASTDLSVTKTDSPDPVPPGTNLTYTVVVSNIGSLPATNVSLSDPMPANTTFVSATAPAGWTVTTPAVGANGTITATNPSLAASAMASFSFVVQPTMAAGGTTITNTATVTLTEPDPNLANNSASATTTVQVATATDFSLATTSPSNLVLTVRPGEAGTFMVALNPIPAGSTFANDVVTSCATNPAVGTCTTPGTIAAGTGATTFPVTITPTIFGAAPPIVGNPTLWLWLAAFALTLAAAGILTRRRLPRASYAVSFGLVLLVASLAMFQSACTGSTGQKLQGPYQVTVTATSGGVTHTTSATYNVSR